jgi:hypothetical protein
VKATAVQTVAFDAKGNHKRALHRQRTTRFGHTVWAHVQAHSPRFMLVLFRKRKENPDKATVFLTVACSEETFSLAHFRP